jgi:hypothetical protein
MTRGNENSHMINGEEIHTFYDHERAFWGCCPWIAIHDSYDGADGGSPYGEGSTEQEAIDELIEKLEI